MMSFGLTMNGLGKPDAGNPHVRFDEGSESDGLWLAPFNPSAPAYSTPELGLVRQLVAWQNPSTNSCREGGAVPWKPRLSRSRKFKLSHRPRIRVAPIMALSTAGLGDEV